MIDQTRIIAAVKAQGGGWERFFRREGPGWQCILFPKMRLTNAQYTSIAHKLSGGLSVEERRRNELRYKASRYG